MFSTVDVTNYGAKPNDGGDDSGAIQAAINASNSGDTIFFPAGTYNVDKRVQLKGGRTYQGAGDNTVLQGGDPTIEIFHIAGQSDITIEDMNFNGQGMVIDGGTDNDIVINNNTFQVNASGANSNGITFTTLLTNSSITNNTFSPINGFCGIYGYYWNGLTIANNEFINGEQGIHLDNLNNSGDNLLIEQNYFTGMKRMGVEYQGGGHNLILQDNWYENPALSSNAADNVDVIAYSIIGDRSTGTIARRNVMIAEAKPDGIGVRLDYEVGGDNTTVTDNYIDGGDMGIVDTDGNGSSVSATNNFITDVKATTFGGGMSTSNNGSGVQLDWSISRGKPGRNKRYGSTSSGGLTNNTSTSSSSSTPAPTTPAPTTPAPVTPAPTPAPPASSTPTTPSKPATPPVADPAPTYVSALKSAWMVNGLGPAEMNHSNGKKGAADGGTITLNGQKYSKGIGVHAGSSLTYKLNGNYTKFMSDIGVDDEVGKHGSVDFEVFVDGVKVYDSGVMTAHTITKSLDIDLSGAKKLTLVVTDGGDGTNSDHADWANARLV
jgi:hypothetical protein